MKEHVIRAILYQDMSVKWKDAELNGDVNVHLNVHQKTRQFVEAELGDFLLSDGEAILASFEKTIDGEIYHENPAKMDNIEGERSGFRLQIPTLVHNTPGEWGVQFFVVTDYDPITGNYTEAYPFDKAKFSEHSSIIDDGLTVPTGENLKVVYEQVREDAKYVGDLLIKYSPLADIYDEAVALIGEYRTFSDVRIMTKAEYEALEEKEEDVIYAFSDDTTMEALENAIETINSFNENAQEAINGFNENAQEAINGFNENAQEAINGIEQKGKVWIAGCLDDCDAPDNERKITIGLSGDPLYSCQYLAAYETLGEGAEARNTGRITCIRPENVTVGKADHLTHLYLHTVSFKLTFTDGAFTTNGVYFSISFTDSEGVAYNSSLVNKFFWEVGTTIYANGFGLTNDGVYFHFYAIERLASAQYVLHGVDRTYTAGLSAVEVRDKVTQVY